MAKEVWVFYKTTYNKRHGYRQYYVSNLGRVMMNGELYICTISKNGYYYLCHIPLHRIIAERFISGWKKDYEVDHINTVKTDNRVENLRICHNRSSNNNNPLTIQHMREGKPTKSILQYTKDGKVVAEYISTHEAERQTNIYHGSIIKCCKNKLKSTGGYIWKYKNI